MYLVKKKHDYLKEICIDLNISPVLLTGQIDFLEKKGYVKRLRLKDRRTVKLFLTKDGKELLQRFYQKV